jgi:hypothetical protein
LDSHGKYFELAKEIICLNLTLYNRSEVFMAIRQLEFSVLQLSRQIDDLLAAIQYVFLGKMPLSFMGPEILMGILRNVSLNLPDGYEMAAGTKMENIHDYDDLVKTEVIADLHSLKLVMEIPLKTADRQFTLYKLVATPSRISGNTRSVNKVMRLPAYRTIWQHCGLALHMKVR